MKIVRPVEALTDRQAALERQRELARCIAIEPGREQVELIGATDVAYEKETDRAHAAVVVLDARTLQVVDQATWSGQPGYPYVPGLFSLRESSCLFHALEALETIPDVLLVDGHGIAHPRRFGLACLLGWALEVPTIGCAKGALVGQWEHLGEQAGSQANLVDEGELVGRVVRTQDGINPVFVSPGHRYDFDTAARVVLSVAGAYRIPEPLRRAHELSIVTRAEHES